VKVTCNVPSPRKTVCAPILLLAGYPAELRGSRILHLAVSCLDSSHLTAAQSCVIMTRMRTTRHRKKTMIKHKREKLVWESLQKLSVGGDFRSITTRDELSTLFGIDAEILNSANSFGGWSRIATIRFNHRVINWAGQEFKRSNSHRYRTMSLHLQDFL